MADNTLVTAVGCSSKNSKDEALFNAIKTAKMHCERDEYVDSYKLVKPTKFDSYKNDGVCATIVARVTCRFPG